MAILALVRHGITEYNRQKRFCGFTDVPITSEGEEQARQVAQQLVDQGVKFDHAYTSWLQRAWQTLDIILGEIQLANLPITKHPFLNERHYGDLQGMLHADAAAQVGVEQVQIWRRSYAVRPPNGESLKDVVHRVQYYFDDVLLPELELGRNLLVVAHGNSVRALVKILESVSDEEIVHQETAHDTPLLYEVSGANSIQRLS